MPWIASGAPNFFGDFVDTSHIEMIILKKYYGVDSMKHLYMIAGPMGVGKTAVSRELQKRLPNCVFLDGDWCWDSSPFLVTEETKAVVLDNICHMLNNFLRCSAYENIVFCWVMHEQEIIDAILERLDAEGAEVTVCALVCKEETLIERLRRDIEAGKRSEDVISRAVERLARYPELDVMKLDTTEMTPVQTAEKIING